MEKNFRFGEEEIHKAPNSSTTNPQKTRVLILTYHPQFWRYGWTNAFTLGEGGLGISTSWSVHRKEVIQTSADSHSIKHIKTPGSPGCSPLDRYQWAYTSPTAILQHPIYWTVGDMPLPSLQTMPDCHHLSPSQQITLTLPPYTCRFRLFSVTNHNTPHLYISHPNLIPTTGITFTAADITPSIALIPF